ncbi:MAG: zinc ABC transporter substrate-binding protein [Kiritimatiellae bacterium]|nr:zinc ABC transporter substrate-binding protein [Kiritimatiellia bacterium]
MNRWFLIAAFAASLSASAHGAQVPSTDSQGGLIVTATLFPVFDWARQIAGGEAKSVDLLLDSGVDLHSYQPSAGDIVKILSSDVFLYVGGESDAWVKDLFARNAKTKVRAVNLLNLLNGAVKAETHEEVAGCGHRHETADREVDEHIWLSLRLAQAACSRLAELFAECDPVNATAYRRRSAAYLGDLRALDEAYRAAVSAAPRKVLLFGDRFPFRYPADDYGLTCYAAFPGCSSETAASFKTIASLSEKMDELDLPAIFILEGSGRQIARTILQNTKRPDRPILTLNSMQGTAKEDVEHGATYLGIMRQNLENLKKAVN